MTAIDKIQNTLKSIEGRIKKLEADPDISLEVYCDRVSSLEHDFYRAVKNILEEKDKDEKRNVSSLNLAKEHGLIDAKD